MNILYIAPYPSSKDKSQGSPGAARKISLTIQILCELGHNVILLNSSHNSESNNIFKEETLKREVFGGIEIDVIEPFMLGSRKIGKIIHLVFIRTILKNITKKYKIDTILIYNTYLFEMASAKILSSKYHIPYAIQVEDLPWSRKRGILNLKAKLETKGFHNICKNAFLVLCVSHQVMSVVKEINRNMFLYPPIIDKDVINFGNLRTYPFSNNKINIGIFGGLNKEKGADKVFDLLLLLDDNYEIHVAGKGPLSIEFERLKNKKTKNFHFYGFITDQEYVSLITNMDILINPHVELSKLSNGVFPFKLFEYLGSGAYVITTQLPSKEAQLLDGICIFDGSSEDLIEKIELAGNNFNITEHCKLRENAINLAGFETVRDRMRDLIEI